MNKTLSVKEYDTIVCEESVASSQGFVYLEKKYFDELEQFIKQYASESNEADILEFMRVGYKRGVGDTVTFNSYVGIVELPSGFQIEILPKVSLSQDDNNAQTKKIFLKMLSCLKEFEGKVFSSASLNAVTSLSNTPPAPRYNKSSENVRWKMRNSTTRKIGIPQILCVNTLSTLSERLIFSFADFLSLVIADA